MASCFKVQIAYYEALGLDGMRAFADTVRYARSRGAVVISDVKRGDIAATADKYAAAHFTGDFETDIVTVNAYMGEDALSPYYPYLERGKGVFVLVRTSNPSGARFSGSGLRGARPSTRVWPEKVAEWGARFVGKSGYSALGAVVGLTCPEQFEAIRGHALAQFFCSSPAMARRAARARTSGAFSEAKCAALSIRRAASSPRIRERARTRISTPTSARPRSR